MDKDTEKTPKPTITTEVITQRERTPANAFKISALTDFLSVVGEEDVDAVFTAVLQLGSDLGYNLKASPEELLKVIEQNFG